MEKNEIQVVHFDVMDNHFVPNLTFGHKLIQDLRPHSSLLFDVHLMIEKPENNIEHYLKAGADIVVIHYEAVVEKDSIPIMSEKVRAEGKKFGISIKPKTPPTVLENFLDNIDLVLVMTVEPGFGGQKIIPECIEKIPYIKQLIQKSQKNIILQIDGGVNYENLESLFLKGADWFVVGSAFFKEKDFSFYPRLLKKIKG